MHNPATIAGRGMPERGRAPTASPTTTAHQISSVPAAIASGGYPPSASETTTYTTATATRRACFIGKRSFTRSGGVPRGASVWRPSPAG